MSHKIEQEQQKDFNNVENSAQITIVADTPIETSLHKITPNSVNPPLDKNEFCGVDDIALESYDAFLQQQIGKKDT